MRLEEGQDGDADAGPEPGAQSHLARHGVDQTMFARALDDDLPIPADIASLPQPRLGFCGSLQDWVDLDLIELNEAFASQSIACINDLGLDGNKVNVNGGAIAIGHPLGCSGVRISTTLVHEMKRSQKKYGLATMCVGVGQGASIIYEVVN